MEAPAPRRRAETQADSSHFGHPRQFGQPESPKFQDSGSQTHEMAVASDAKARLQAARQILLGEANAILQISEQLDDRFLTIVDAMANCSGQIIVSGMGKAGLVGQKISATLASTGSRSIFLHPSEAVHGDLGRVHHDDILLLLSYSGETDELNRLLPMLRSQASLLIALTSTPHSTLGKAVDHVLPLGALREVCPLGLAPSTSTTAMLALGDALALLVSQQRGFTREAFARNHPGGNLGRQLAPVEQVMRSLDSCRMAHCQTTLCNVLVSVSKPGRRSGAVMLVDDDERLVGIFTDSDLARLLEQRKHEQLDAPIAQVMTTRFRTITAGSLLSNAIDMLCQFKISELPVIDQQGKPVGLIDITDVVSLVAHAEQLQAQSNNNGANDAHPHEVHIAEAHMADAPIREVDMSEDGQVISLSINTATTRGKLQRPQGRDPRNPERKR